MKTTRMHKRLSILVLALLLPVSAAAQDSVSSRHLARQLGAALSYNGQAPTENPGFSSLFLRSSVMATTVEDRIVREQVRYRTQTLVIPLLRESSGIARHVDVDGYSAASSSGDAQLYGVSARYALVKEQAGQPPLASIRANYSGLQGEDVVDVSSRSLELTFTRPNKELTPYWGLGQVWVSALHEGVGGDGTGQVRLTKRYIGFSLDDDQRRAAFEVDRTGEITTVGARFSFNF